MKKSRLTFPGSTEHSQGAGDVKGGYAAAHAVMTLDTALLRLGSQFQYPGNVILECLATRVDDEGPDHMPIPIPKS